METIWCRGGKRSRFGDGASDELIWARAMGRRRGLWILQGSEVVKMYGVQGVLF